MARKLIISIGADHGGFSFKQEIIEHLESLGYVVLDKGTNSIDSCDYPEFGYAAAKAVAEKKADIGIVICRSGFGMCIVANKVKGVRCAVCKNIQDAQSAREHNFCNVLSLAGDRISLDEAKSVIETFINTPFGQQRHQDRVNKITDIENKE